MKLSLKSYVITGITMLSVWTATCTSAFAAPQKGNWSVYTTKTVNLYNKADFKTKTSSQIGSQVVTATEKDGNWYRIQTWLGDKYIWNESNSIQEQSGVPFAKTIISKGNLNLYDKPFAKYKTSLIVGPQKLQATEKWGNYYKIKTWLGDKFVYIANPTIETVSKPNVLPLTNEVGTTKNSAPIYNIPNTTSPIVVTAAKGAKVDVLSKNATWAEVSYQNKRGFVPLSNVTLATEKVSDTSGVPGSFIAYVTKSSYLYTDAADNKKTTSQIGPQRVFVLERKGDFLKIKTWLGDRWITLREAPTSYVSDFIRPEAGKITVSKAITGQSYPFSGFAKGNVAANTYAYTERSGKWYHVVTSTLDVWVQSDNAPSPNYPTTPVNAPYQIVSNGAVQGYSDEQSARIAFATSSNDAYITKDGVVIDMKQGFLRASGGTTINVYTTNGVAFTYVPKGVEIGFKKVNGSKVEIDYHGITGYVNAIDVDLVPFAKNESRNYFKPSNGTLYHYIYTASKGTYYGSPVGPVPAHLVDGQIYYSNDNRFINGKESYNYFQYLPLRTPASYTAAEINAFIDENAPANSIIRGSGQAFINAANKYNINVGYLVSHAILESGWGTSEIARTKLNLFGFKAVDSNPLEGAATFKTLAEGIDYCAWYIDTNYLNASDWRYFGAFVGEKGRGMNVKYASDPYWGESISSIMNRLDKRFSNKEYKKVTYGIVPQGTPFYNISGNTKTTIYTAPVDITVVGVGTITNSLGTWYQVKSDNTAYSTLYVPANQFRNVTIH